MTDHLAHLQHPTVRAAEAALDRHLAEYPEDRDVPHQRNLSPEGKRLHDAVVLAAQAAYRAEHPEAFVSEPSDG
jgi:hypothetical protein